MTDKKKKRDEEDLEDLYGEDYETALQFADEIFEEFNNVIKSVVYFGSSSRKKSARGDIDVLIIFNDASVISDDDFKAYFNKKLNDVKNRVSDKLHVNVVTLTVFFENLLNGEPVVMNVLRDGVALIDTGFFAPLKVLLLKGRIKPSAEAILNAASRVEAHISQSRLNLLSAYQELYLSMLDAAQATLMAHGISAPSPRKVPELLKTIKVRKNYIDYFKEMQDLFKKIEHEEVNEIKGADYDDYKKKAESFNEKLEEKLKKKI